MTFLTCGLFVIEFSVVYKITIWSIPNHQLGNAPYSFSYHLKSSLLCSNQFGF